MQNSSAEPKVEPSTANNRTLAAFGFGLCLFGLVAQSYFSIIWALDNGYSLVGAIVRYFSFLTTLSNLAMALAFLAYLAKPFKWTAYLDTPFARSSIASIITLVAVYYHLFLSGDSNDQGMELITNFLRHYLNPVIYIYWVVAKKRSGTLKYLTAFPMLIPMLIYCAYTIARGALTNIYPYAIVDVTKLGYAGIVPGIFALAAAILILNIIYVAIDRSILLAHHFHP